MQIQNSNRNFRFMYIDIYNKYVLDIKTKSCVNMWIGVRSKDSNYLLILEL